MGAAIEVFEGARALNVPRTRFAPVKTTDDLLALRSDAYRLTDDARVELAREAVPIVTLDSDHYKLIRDFEAALPEGAAVAEGGRALRGRRRRHLRRGRRRARHREGRRAGDDRRRHRAHGLISCSVPSLREATSTRPVRGSAATLLGWRTVGSVRRTWFVASDTSASWLRAVSVTHRRSRASSTASP